MAYSDVTLCNECRYVKAPVDGDRQDNLHYRRCGAVRYRQIIDPVSSEIAYIVDGYIEDNSLKLSKHPHPYCGNVNKGRCPHFKMKGPGE